jgi:hypothetical protein
VTGLTASELAELESATDEHTWNAICDRVKTTHRGYPPDWYSRVVQSGLLDRVAKGWSVDIMTRRHLPKVSK